MVSSIGILPLILLGAGGLIAAIGGLMFLIAAFKQHILWGFSVLLIPFAAVVYFFMHLKEAAIPFVIHLAGMGIAFAGAFIAIEEAGGIKKLLYVGKPPEEIKQEAQAELMDSRISMMDLENEVLIDRQELSKAYEEIAAMKKTMNTKLSKDVLAFNEAVTKFNQMKGALDIKERRLAEMRGEFEQKLESVSAIQPASSEVVIYTTKTCAVCISAKKYLQARQIPFREVDVQSSPEAMEEFQKFKINGVPVIVVKGTVVRGFDQAKLDQLLPGTP